LEVVKIRFIATDSLGDDADNAFGKSEENNNTVQDCQCIGDGFHHDDLERVEASRKVSDTLQDVNHDGLMEDEKTMFDMI
jgi:hypothetical protein